jgi:glycosyltransferase involved in cell wall biosynthesis
MSSVSVVIPCYNYGHFLRDAVDSALTGQGGVDVRVLIIDDTSTDDSAEVAQKIAADDSRVEVIVHTTNKKNLATYNEGLLEWADGDYSVLLDADDRLTPGALKRGADFLDAHPRATFVYGHPLHFQEGLPLPTARTRVQGWTVWPGQQWVEQRFRAAHNCITTPEVMVRTSAQHKVGGYDARLPHSGDLEMWMRLAAHGEVGYLRGVDQALYRVHDSNMTKSRTLLVDLAQRRLAYEVLLENTTGTLADADRLSNLVHRKLSHEALWRAARAYDRGRTEQVPVDDLVDFALSCWPAADRLPIYRTLQLRRLIGRKYMPYLQPLILSAVVHKARNWWWWRTWAKRGV